MHLFAMKRNKPFFKYGCNLYFPEDASFIPKSGMLIDAFLNNSLASETCQKLGKALYAGNYYLDKTNLVCSVGQILCQFSGKKVVIFCLMTKC